MKTRIVKAFVLLLWLGLWQTGCYPDKFDPEGDEVGPIATLDFSDPSVEFKSTAESREVTVTTNYKTYRVNVPEEATSWCHVTAEGMMLKIAVDENPFSRERSATISVSVAKGSKELTKTVSVFQAGTLPQIKYDHSNLIFQQKDAVAWEVNVTTNQDEWTYAVVGGDDAWFEVTRSGDKLQVMPKSDNTEAQLRNGYINLTASSASSDATASGVISVEQLGTAPALRLSENAFSLPVDGGIRRVRVVTNQPAWQLVLPQEEWYAARQEGDEVVINVNRNTGGNIRKSEFTVTTPNFNAYANLSLAQLGTALSLEVSADTLLADATESYSTLWVTTNADEWSASVEGGAGWCELLEDANMLTVYTKANPSTTEARECVISVRAGDLQKRVCVMQQPNMTLTLNHDTLKMAASGETRNVLVLTNQDSWKYSMTLGMEKWCSAVANGNMLSVTVAASGDVYRSGEITVTVGKPGMEKKAVLVVTQEGFSDREALMAIWKANGEKWNTPFRHNWGTDLPISSWKGVTCNEDGRVIELSFRELGDVCLDPALGKLTELEEIDASYECSLTGEIPAEIGNLRKLKKLEWGSDGWVKHHLTGSIPKELGNLTALTSLDLSDNALTGEIPGELGKLENLTQLYLSGNDLSGRIPAELGNLSKLVWLYLHNNALDGNIPKELGNLVKLVHLSMHNNNLTGEVPKELGKLQLLQTTSYTNVLGNTFWYYGFSLCGNRLTGVFPEEVKALPHWNSFVPDEGIYPQQEGYGFTQPENPLVDEVWCVSGENNTIRMNVSSLKNLVVDIPGEYSWIKNVSEEGADSLLFSIDANGTGDYRKGFVNVKGQYGSACTISVYQGVGDSLYIYADTPGMLRTLVGKERLETTRGLKLSGTLGQDDYDAMKYSMSRLVSIDMEEVENTSIPARAFYGKSVFNRVVLPSKLEEIGDKAFYDCGFRGELKLPETVTRIGISAFESCNNITGVLRLPAGLQEVGESAFAYCTGLRGDLILPDGLKVINRRAFYCNYFDGKLVLPASCVEIGESAFAGCESLTGNVVIPDGVRKIGKEAFNYCKKISGVTLSAALEEIGESAFYYCIKLTGDLVVPSHVRIIGDRAFASCAFTGTLTLPSGLETIGTEAFLACSFTGGLNLPSTLARIGKRAFSSCSGFTGNLVIPENVKVIEASAFAGCRGLNGTLTLPSGLERIDQDAFWSCKSLSGSLVLPASLRTIGQYAFSNCDSFSGDLVIPEGVTEIASYAFCCKGMKNTIVLPSTLVSLGYQAFYGMPDITYVRCNRKEPLALSLSPFANAAECTLIVPKGSLETYKAAAMWNEFGVIEEEK